MFAARTFRRSARAAALSAAALVALPALAHAADAPLRTIGIDAAGARTSAFAPRGVSPNGSQVIFQGENQAWVRDVTAGTTKALFPVGDSVLATSNDTTQVLLDTTRKLVSADTDADHDVYLVDRSTGAAKLVTQDKLGLIENSSSTDYATTRPRWPAAARWRSSRSAASTPTCRTRPARTPTSCGGSTPPAAH